MEDQFKNLLSQRSVKFLRFPNSDGNVPSKSFSSSAKEKDKKHSCESIPLPTAQQTPKQIPKMIYERAMQGTYPDPTFSI